MKEPIDKEQFMQWLTTLSEVCRQTLSSNTIAGYYSYCNGKLSTEQFCNAAQQLFEQGCDRLPPPVEWVKLARSLTPDLALPAASEAPVAYSDLNDFEKAKYRRSIQASRELVKSAIAPTASGFTSLGAALGGNEMAIAAQKRQAVLDKMNRWLSDDLLRPEAIAWAMIQPDIALVQNELGEVSGLRWEVEGEATA